ncbi:MAG: zf-HC2 domain-containing protein [Erysipelotrichaceae bacterium]
MKQTCSIVEDLLPLYIEDSLQVETTAILTNHLEQCSECNAYYHGLQTPLIVEESITEGNALTQLAKTIKRKRKKASIVAMLISVVILITMVAQLTTPHYLGWDEVSSTIQIQERDGMVQVCFIGSYTLQQQTTGVYELSIYTTLWDKLTDASKSQTIIINPDNEPFYTLTYVSSNGESNRVVYGSDLNPNGGVISLPRLVLGMYLSLSLLLSSIFLLLYLVTRRYPRLLQGIFTLLGIPLSYCIAFVCIKGVNGTSYHVLRDFYLILCLMVPIYLLLWVARDWVHKKRRVSNVMVK